MPRWSQHCRGTLLALCVAVVCALLPAGASAQSLGGFLSPGELAEAHAELTGISHCLDCHSVGSGLSATKCMACHDTVRDQVDQQRGFHADKGDTCEGCHLDHRGPGFDMVHMEQVTFDHSATGFDLHGSHLEAECSDCHQTDGQWTGESSVCKDCHEDPHGSAVARPLISQCERCHEDTRWRDVGAMAAVFDHTDESQVDYTLHGQHVDVACKKCHADFKFVPTASESCEDCHEDPHRGQFRPRGCDTCHTVDVAGFRLRNFNHTRTRWPLSGAHRPVACATCHGRGHRAQYRPLPHERCDTCHEDPHDGEFAPRDCDACHSDELTTFAMAGFDHGTTDFPLRGAHEDVACVDCHEEASDGHFTGLEHDDCSSCHEDEHAGRFEPDWCVTCHTDGTWEVEDFDHGRTDFPLTGAHEEASCAECHGEEPDEVFTPIAHDGCLDCHEDDDPHSAEVTQICTTCHVTAAWEQVTFDHVEETGFPLTGKHDGVACEACHHEDRTFGQATDTCEACHEDDRPSGHFQEGCGGCHTNMGWLPATFGEGGDHAITGFALHGSHTGLECDACHDGRPSTAPFCEACHADDDPHANLLGNTCDACHTETAWFTVRYSHNLTGWPLRGAHRLAACSDCHATGFVGTPTACRRCHENRKPTGDLHDDPLIRDCETCHRPYGWETANTPHRGF